MISYDLHPEAFTDIDEITIYIGQESLEAAHRVVDEVYQAIGRLVPFPHQGHSVPILPTARFVLSA